MWAPLFAPKLHLIDGARKQLRHYGQELTHYAVHNMEGSIRWFDGEHGFNPYNFAELNLTRGHQADHGAERVLVKRCLTAFQWESQMDVEIANVLATDHVAAVLAVPYDALFTHMELQDWEQEDYVRYNVAHLQKLVKKHSVPILAMVDMKRLWKTHPTLASMMLAAADVRWSLSRPDGRWRVETDTGEVIDPYLRRQGTLLEYLSEEEQRLVHAPRPNRRKPVDPITASPRRFAGPIPRMVSPFP